MSSQPLAAPPASSRFSNKDGVRANNKICRTISRKASYLLQGLEEEAASGDQDLNYVHLVVEN